MKRILICLGSFILSASMAQAAPSIITQGRAFAIEACSACHQVRPGQTPPPAVHDANFDEDILAPSFMEIARTHGTNIEYLRKHITEPEWPMREQMMDDYYLYDIIAYIARTEARCKSYQMKRRTGDLQLRCTERIGD